MEADKIRLSRKVVSVPLEKRTELYARLENAGQRAAAQELRYRGALTETQKPGVLVLLDVWLTEVGKDVMGEELLDLREELDHDVNRQHGGQ